MPAVSLTDMLALLVTDEALEAIQDAYTALYPARFDCAVEPPIVRITEDN